MISQGLDWVTIDTPIELKEVSAPGTPPADNLRLYAKDKSGTSALFYKDDAGTEKDLSGGLLGSGTANRLAYWSAATTLASVAALTQNRLVTADANGLPTSIAALTQGSVLFADSNGLPTQDNTNLTFLTDTLTATKLLAPTSVSTPSLISTAALTITPVAGSNLNISLSTTGDLAVNTSQLYVDTSVARVGINTATPAADLHVSSDSGEQARFVAPTSGDGYINLQAGTATTGIFANRDTSAGFGSVSNHPLVIRTNNIDRFQVGPSGQWGIGGATYGTAAQYFRSAGAAAAPTWATPTFLELSDAPSSFSGEANKVVRVNSGETALEFVPSLTAAEIWTRVSLGL